LSAQRTDVTANGGTNCYTGMFAKNQRQPL
jgi:hypothetical protein